VLRRGGLPLPKRTKKTYPFPRREQLLAAVVGGCVMVMAVVVVIRPKNKNKKVFY